jgi:trypsin-like peptidase/NACHT domain-containing protein
VVNVDQELEMGLVEVCGSSVGSGFLVAEDLIVTCAHVVGSPQAKPKVVFLGAAAPSPASVVPDLWRSEQEGDIAVLKLGAPPQGRRPLRLGRTSGTEGHSCSTLGFPDVSAVQVVRGQGIIRALVFDRWGNRKLQLSSKEITGGFSGAPLLDVQTKRVVGMVVWNAEKIPEVAWAVPAEALHSVLSARVPDLSLDPPQALEDYLHQVEQYCDRDAYHIVDDVRRAVQSLYVPLMVRHIPPPLEERDKKRPRIEKITPEADGILPAARMLATGDQPHAIIMAAPGSGKSTLLRYFARCAWAAPSLIGLTAPHIPLPAVLGALAVERPIKVALAEALACELSLMEAVPDGWWDGWPSQAQANWLILLDALDEVWSENHRTVLDRLNTLGREVTGHRIVVTANHAGYTYGELDPKLFRHYELRPFDQEATREFARRWFGNRTDKFLGELDGLDASDLKDTPLLLTLAAKMYDEKHVLAKQRCALYEDLVERSLERAISSGLNYELESELGKEFKGGPGLHLDNLAYLAQRMTASDQASAGALMAERLIPERMGWGKAAAEDYGSRWANIMGRRSGLLVSNRGGYAFWHLTVREYLTAKWLLETEGLQGMVDHHWSEVRYEEVRKRRTASPPLQDQWLHRLDGICRPSSRRAAAHCARPCIYRGPPAWTLSRPAHSLKPSAPN